MLAAEELLCLFLHAESAREYALVGESAFYARFHAVPDLIKVVPDPAALGALDILPEPQQIVGAALLRYLFKRRHRIYIRRLGQQVFVVLESAAARC